MNEVFHIQNCPQMNTDFRAVFVGNTLRLINENPNNRFVRGTSNLRVHQLEAVVDCHPFSDFLNPSCNRSVCHSLPSSGLPPKRKSGREPTGQDPVPSSKLGIIRKRQRRSNLTRSERIRPLELRLG